MSLKQFVVNDAYNDIQHYEFFELYFMSFRRRQTNVH